jgi:hypothetical protein
VTDREIRERNNHIDVIDYGPTTPTVAPSLAQARVAIVTTAGLRPDGIGTWSEGQGFTVLAHGDHHVTVAHASANFDRAHANRRVGRVEDHAGRDGVDPYVAAVLGGPGGVTKELRRFRLAVPIGRSTARPKPLWKP